MDLKLKSLKAEIFFARNDIPRAKKYFKYIYDHVDEVIPNKRYFFSK